MQGEHAPRDARIEMRKRSLHIRIARVVGRRGGMTCLRGDLVVATQKIRRLALAGGAAARIGEVTNQKPWRLPR
jgi:hypothetical protein